MDTKIVVSVISALALIVAPAFSFYWTRRKEREAEWPKQKREQYRELLEAISSTVGTDATPEGQLRFARACNTIGLIASQSVLKALWQFQDATAKSNPNRSLEQHDRCLNQLLLAIRVDLGVSPKDDPSTFQARLWASGVDK